MKLIDSSAWIEYYRKNGKREYKACVSDAIRDNTAAVNGIIHLEILVFAKTQSEFDAISADFSSLHQVELDVRVFQEASKIGFDLRRKGITIPASDLIIAASAIIADAELVHLDSHYALIGEHYPLRINKIVQ